MKFLLILLLTLPLFAQSSCYTVQLLSRNVSQKSHTEIYDKKYDSSCKIMKIGASVTVRCGCFTKYKRAVLHAKEFKTEYPSSFITQTYRSRFEPEIKPEVKIIKPQSIEPKEETITLLPVETKRVEKQEEKKKIEVAVEPKKVEVQKPTKRKKKKKLKKKKKKTKVKKKKKDRTKIVKKRDATASYDYFLSHFKSKKPSKKLGYNYSFGAEVLYDVTYVDEADIDYFDNYFRRLRVNHKGDFLDERLFYQLEYSFTGNNNYKDIYAGWRDKFSSFGLSYRFKFGNIKIPFSLERYSSLKNLTFMDRSSNDAFSLNRKGGAEIFLSQKLATSRINLFGSIFANSIDERKDKETNKEGYSARVTFANKFSPSHIFSIGGAYLSRDMQGDDIKVNYKGAKAVQEKYLSVKILDTERLSQVNLEALYIYHEYSLQAEYAIQSIDALNKREYIQNYTFDSYYVQGSWFAIGKGRSYKMKRSAFGKIKPKKGGALEFALRYSYINLTDTSNDKDEIGGSQTDYTMGVNWYINKELKLMFNYVISEPTQTDEYDGLLQIAQMRAQFTF